MRYNEVQIREEAEFLIREHATIRQTAKKFGVSKSKVYRDLTIILEQVSYSLYQKVREVLDYNLSVRASRGGKGHAAKVRK